MKTFGKGKTMAFRHLTARVNPCVETQKDKKSLVVREPIFIWYTLDV